MQGAPSAGQRPAKQDIPQNQALKGRNQYFALSGLTIRGVFQFVGRCPTLLICKAFSLNLTAMAKDATPS